MNNSLKILLVVGVIAFSASIMATSCDKDGGGGGNNANGLVPTTNLTLWVNPLDKSFIKVSDNTVIVNATGMSSPVDSTANPHSAADDKDRGFRSAANKSLYLFYVLYPGPTDKDSATMIFVNRAHVTKDTIALKAMPNARSSTASDDCKIGSESSENDFAKLAEGAHCRYFWSDNNADGTPDNGIGIDSYLGTLFNNTDTANRARGTMQCESALQRIEKKTGTDGRTRENGTLINDTTLLNTSGSSSCRLAMINNGGSAAAAEIDDAWVTDSKSTTEVELYAIGVNVTDKPIPKWSDAPGYGLDEFRKAHDNAAFKRLLKNNPWGELKFKVKFITSTDFAALP